jgi:spore coat-associated protein N
VSRAADQVLTTGHQRSRRSSIALNAFLFLAALAIAVAALMGTPDAKRETPTLDVINRDGIVQISDSLEGLPIVSVGNLKPGQTASGQVTLQNTGTVRGYFYLAPLDLVSPPGPGGGTLAQNLIVKIFLTKGGTTSQKFGGALSNMGTITAGRFSPGESGTYRFEVQAKDTGMPAPPTLSRPVRGDNKYQGTSASVTFGWSTSPG